MSISSVEILYVEKKIIFQIILVDVRVNFVPSFILCIGIQENWSQKSLSQPEFSAR